MHRVTTIEYNKSNFTSGSGFGKGTGRGCGVIKSGGSSGGGNGDGYGHGREIIDTYSRWHLRKYEKIVPIEVVIYEVHR